jgi:hypothetical protein
LSVHGRCRGERFLQLLVLSSFDLQVGLEPLIPQRREIKHEFTIYKIRNHLGRDAFGQWPAEPKWVSFRLGSRAKIAELRTTATRRLGPWRSQIVPGDVVHPMTKPQDRSSASCLPALRWCRHGGRNDEGGASKLPCPDAAGAGSH